MFKKTHIKEALLYVGIIVLISLGLIELDAFEWFYEFSRSHEEWELDEFVLILPSITVCLALFAVQRMRDVRRRAKALEEARKELSAANERLVDMAQTRDEFLTMASHELRSPLVGITNSLSLINLLDDEEEREESLQYAITTAKGMSVLINDVLVFARLSKEELGGKVAFEPAGLLDSIQALAQLQADAKGLELQTKQDESVPESVMGYESGLRIAILNLVGNGIKFTESGGVTVSVSCSRGEGCAELVVKVTDTGIGISPEEQEVIFEPYRTVGKNGQSGIGLGLSLVSRVVDKMGGSLSVSSELGQGAEFTVSVPVDTHCSSSDIL